ncbi:hypothetical protein N9Z02_00390, partial [Akkermansiaceae bacterium]|nr:hypothetical protein [Akkermansiaceae bacterium]
KKWLPSAIFIGFTGTPLLKKDKKNTRDAFGTNIHTYKFHEAVEDGVVLDLKYEARDVPQEMNSREQVDEWFEANTKGLNNYQKNILKKEWANLENIFSSAERKQRIIQDIIKDFAVKPRLNNDRGTAILVAASIYDACHYYQLLQNLPFGKHCGIITSFEPNASVISTEAEDSDERFKYDVYVKQVLSSGQSTAEYEEEMKRRFIHEPANCKLLIVVSKLLTGFDAPSCTYIYLDNILRDHTLFQAICRTNRLDGDDKDYGHIVDYKKLMEAVNETISVYTSDEIDNEDEENEPNGVEIKDWLTEGKEKLDEARTQLKELCEDVSSPKEIENYLTYFCGRVEDENGLEDTEPLRVEFYKRTTCFFRRYADIASHLSEAGYTNTEITEIEGEVSAYNEIKSAVKHHSGEELDTKPFEAGMRHLMNTYIQADHAESLGQLGEMSLTELIVETGMNDAIAMRLNEQGKISTKSGIAEAVINNIRKTVIKDRLTDPQFYEQMSALLTDLIQQSRESADDYEAFLSQAEELAKRLINKHEGHDLPPTLRGKALAIRIYHNIPDNCLEGLTEDQAKDKKQELSLAVEHIVTTDTPPDWRGDSAKEIALENKLYEALEENDDATDTILALLKEG